MYQSESINEIATALSKMQQKVGSIAKNKKALIPTKNGGKFEFTYADLAAILDATRKPLGENGLAISQTFLQENGFHYISTMLLHSSGQWLKSLLPINVSAVDIKQLGAQITYSRRYAITSLLGICADDDNEEILEEEKNAITPSSPVPLPQKKNEGALITRKQADELNEIIEDCAKEYKKQVFDFLKKQSINSFYELPKELYERVKTAALRNQEETFEKEVVNA